MTATTLGSPIRKNVQRFAKETDSVDSRVRVSLQFDARVSRLLEEMCDKGEANSISDAIGRLMSIGIQSREQFRDGFTEVIFQNPKKKVARGIDLYRNLDPE